MLENKKDENKIMNIKIQIQEIDYSTIAESLYPSLKEKISSSKKFLSGLFKILGEIPLKALSIIPQNKKSELTVFLLNQVKKDIMEQLQEQLSDKGILLASEEPEITNCDNDIMITVNDVQITSQNTKTP